MNTIEEQKAQLKAAGYTYRYSGNMHEWLSPSGELVASEYKGSFARERAFTHLTNNR